MHSSLVAILGALAIVQAQPTYNAKRDIIAALPGSADATETKFQPLLDFDSDGCYNTAAISPDGTTNPGKGATGTPQGGCRDPPQLQNSNAYSRKRCNNGYCAIMYEYFFEKDQAIGGSFLGGHRFDWENIVSFSIFSDDLSSKVIGTNSDIGCLCQGRPGRSRCTLMPWKVRERQKRRPPFRKPGTGRVSQGWCCNSLLSLR